MSISRKLLIFAVILVVIPMAILSIVSNFVLNEQLHKSEQSYLENALKIARLKMVDRREEMDKCGSMTVQSVEFQALVQKHDAAIAGSLQRLKRNYGYLDIITVLNPDKTPWAHLSPDARTDAAWDLNGLVDKARTARRAVIAAEVLPLSALFYPDSSQYRKFLVRIMTGRQEHGQGILDKCLIGIAVIPVLDDMNPASITGYLVLGDIVNNDDFFPLSYSRNVQNSYLAISVDGIRVTSNIRTGEKQDYIGSAIPVKAETLEGSRQYYFGRVNIDGEIHVFMDAPLQDSNGKVVGALGVGIPEEKFLGILSINRNLIVVVTLSCLSVMLLFGRYLSARITRPIIAATDFAERLGKGERELTLPPYLLADARSETTILLKTFQHMAQELKQGEERRKNYLNRLRQKQIELKKLAKQLKQMNDELEETVTNRTWELQQAIIALKKADEVKSQFLANMSHELRTPLNAIISSSEVLKEKLFGQLNDKQEKYIGNILSSGTHLLQLINDILDISKIEAGKMKLSLAEFYIAEIIETSLTIVKSLAYRKNIEVVISVAPPDFKMRADARKVKQILYNLLSNAVKFTPDNGKVELECYLRHEMVQIRVKDNGIGIKAEDRKRVFIEFEQVDSSYSRQYEGTGLGLPLTKKLVEMHGGQIDLYSEIGRGTEVTVTLPADAEMFLSGNRRMGDDGNDKNTGSR